MHEPDVVLTDYLLALESATFAVSLWPSGSASPLARLFALFFAAIGLSALTGGTVHGFLPAHASTAGRALWRATLIALGLAAACAWSIGARLLFGGGAASRVQMAAVLEWGVYAVVVGAVTDRFWVAVANYLPATLFLMAAFAGAYGATPATPLALGLLGLALTMAAAAIQGFRLSLHRVYCSHNALYHAVQAVALFLIFRSAQFLAARS